MALTATAPDTPAEFLSYLAPTAVLRQFSVDFPREPSSAGHARQIARERLAAWEAPQTGDLVERVVLTISELMSNAIQHGGSEPGGRPEIALSIRFLPGVAIGVRVEDRSPVMPVLRERRSAEAVDGRGMQLVASESTCWTAEQLGEGQGKAVWAFFQCFSACPSSAVCGL
ncbi:ATP-binding protein [Streptomyces sp. OspMP-M43]|uniref:ATP-binding protein n=1 Tax=Streptomyces sp. OspMP-M43 TaxID=1839781 RepID=UPI00114D31DC|nr:ATP-binding protein [Streptomyces sp. OspMP-M43]